MADLKMLITAEDTVDDIERHFKISAGPGAGKTRWLINHIKNVIKTSTRLGNARKVACITFTNVAAETIIERLGTHVNRVEVSTIHSFLYNNIIKPFAYLIPSEHELDIKRIDGHDDVPVYKGWLYPWKSSTGQTYLKDDDKIVLALKDLAWHIEGESLVLKTRKPWTAKIGTYNLKKESYLEYKKLYWRKGWIDHDDVLYFAFVLFREQPRLLEVLRAKFPYFFIDEFQDTNPIQTKLIKEISATETIVGVIGDEAQSIYGFQGAKPEQFIDFKLPEIKEYIIADNYRSTKKITFVLNKLRNNLQQDSKRGILGTTPSVLVGSKFWAIDKAKEMSNDIVQILSRDNLTSNVMREGIDIDYPDLTVELRTKDSDIKRANVILASLTSVEFAKVNRFKDSLKVLIKEIKKSESNVELQGHALLILQKLLQAYPANRLINLYQYYLFLRPLIGESNFAALRSGAAKEFYEQNIYEKVALSININEDSSISRTIHKAKGAEFDNVLLICNGRSGDYQEIKDLGFLLKPNLLDDEEHRVSYVALSRARDRLFINVPSLSKPNEALLREIGFDVVYT